MLRSNWIIVASIQPPLSTSDFSTAKVFGQLKIIVNIIRVFNTWMKILHSRCLSEELRDITKFWFSFLGMLCQAFTEATFCCRLFVGLSVLSVLSALTVDLLFWVEIRWLTRPPNYIQFLCFHKVLRCFWSTFIHLHCEQHPISFVAFGWVWAEYRSMCVRIHLTSSVSSLIDTPKHQWSCSVDSHTCPCHNTMLPPCLIGPTHFQRIGYLGNFHSTCCHSDILQHIGPCFGCKLVMPFNHKQWCIICKTQQKTIVGELLAEAQQSSVSHTSRSISQVIICHVRSQSVTQVKNVKKKPFELCWCTFVRPVFFSQLFPMNSSFIWKRFCFILSRHSAAWH